jgi:hypothetical protein
MESSLDDGKQNNAVFLVEEVIAEEKQGLFRKYLNNVSPVPLMTTCKEDEERLRASNVPGLQPACSVLEDEETSIRI